MKGKVLSLKHSKSFSFETKPFLSIRTNGCWVVFPIRLEKIKTNEIEPNTNKMMEKPFELIQKFGVFFLKNFFPWLCQLSWILDLYVSATIRKKYSHFSPFRRWFLCSSVFLCLNISFRDLFYLSGFCGYFHRNCSLLIII